MFPDYVVGQTGLTFESQSYLGKDVITLSLIHFGYFLWTRLESVVWHYPPRSVLFIILLDNRWCVVDCNPHSVLLGSRAWLTSVSGQSSVNLASPTLPDLSMEMFTTVNGPYVVQKEKKVAHTKSHPPQGKHWREWKQSPQHLSQKAHVLFSKAAALI